ncbi:MAG: HEAT repeat domain-containing protein, partial [Chloroflexi bacterium]|nr:HEAT repeat domain-containing protein [Chloroflexota bacterium]
REIDYAEVLREKRGTDTSLDAVIAAALDGAQLQLDDETIDRLLAILGDPEQLDALMAQLELAAKARGADARAAAVIKMMQSIILRAKERDPGELAGSLRQLGRVASRLSADDMLRLLAQRDVDGEGGDTVGAVLNQLEDADVAKFVAGSVIAEHGATARLAHAFQALVPDIDRQRRLLAIAQEEVAASAVAQDASFDELWTRVESMVTSYSDANYVSRDYARELWTAQTQAVPVEGTDDDPPERVTTWMGTVGDAALRQLDHLLLQDLLAIEQDSARWRDIAETVAAHAEDLVRVGHFDQAWTLSDAVIREAQSSPMRREYLPQILQRFGRGAILKHVASYLRSADDVAFERFQRLCHAIGTPVIAPLAEALSAEQDARSRRRLRDVLVAFGAHGRDVVQQLMHAPNWEVRRTAAFLLREFGGSEGLHELIPLLTDNEPLVQREAVQALVIAGSDDAARILVNALGSITGRARETLVSQLLSVRDRRAAPLFVYLVRKLDRRRHLAVYLAAIDALGAMGETDAVDALKGALHQGDWWAPGRTRRARGAAAAALRRIGSPAALDVLKAASKAGSVKPLLQAAPSLAIGIVAGQFVVADTPMPKASASMGELIKRLKDQGIERISLDRGLTADEVLAFMLSVGAGHTAPEPGGWPHLRIGRITADEHRSDGVAGDMAAIRRLYANSVHAAETVWETAEVEGAPDLPGALRTVDGLADAVTQNRTAIVALTAMRNYDNYTFTHMVNVSILTMGQARTLGIEGRLLREFGLSALMHDIGKVRTPKEILNKTEKLTDDEIGILRRHPVDGAEILRRTPEMPVLAPVVAFEHHLRTDGSGYPAGARREALNLGTMLTSIADVYDAMRSQRQYQQAFPSERILAVLKHQEGRLFDQHLVRRFVQLL